MAEVVGVVVGVVSFGVQLAESLQKVKRFYEAVRGAPERLADIVDEIEPLSDILTELEQDPTSSRANTGPNVQRCVAACRKAVDQFWTCGDSLESRMKRCKRRGSIKFAMKTESIESVIASLETSKSNLMLAYMLYREAMAERRARLMQEQMEALASGQTLILQQHETPQDARLATDKRIERQPHRRSGRGTRPFLKTPSWLSRTVLEMGMDRAISGWTFSIRSYSLVLYTNPVYIACHSGDMALMHRIFDRREASPFDEVDIFNHSMSLLDIAVMQNQMEAARLLLRSGATSLAPWALAVALEYHQQPTRESISLQHDWYRFLVVGSELDWTKEDTFPPIGIGAVDLAVHAFIFGNTEESTAAFFWIRLSGEYDYEPDPEYWIDLDNLALHNDISYLLKHREYGDKRQLKDLAMAYVSRAVRGPRYDARDSHSLERLVAGAIDLGLDVHESGDGISPLLHILHERKSVFSAIDMEPRLEAWLSLLKRFGVNLQSYGQEEWDRFQGLRRICERPWDWGHGVDRHRCEYFSWCLEAPDVYLHRLESSPTLSAVTYAENVSDWNLWILHPGDQYAGQFWRLIEQNGIYSRHIPGSWVEDE